MIVTIRDYDWVAEEHINDPRSTGDNATPWQRLNAKDRGLLVRNGARIVQALEPIELTLPTAFLGCNIQYQQARLQLCLDIEHDWLMWNVSLVSGKCRFHSVRASVKATFWLTDASMVRGIAEGWANVAKMIAAMPSDWYLRAPSPAQPELAA
jgi:hypothetical protein